MLDAEDYIQLAEEEESPKEEEEEEVIVQKQNNNDENSTHEVTKQYFIPPQTGEYKFFSRCSTHCDVTLGDDKVLPEEEIISIRNEYVGQRKGLVKDNDVVCIQIIFCIIYYVQLKRRKYEFKILTFSMLVIISSSS